MTEATRSRADGIVALNDPEELDRFLLAYRPRNVAPTVWVAFASDAAELVKKAGPLRRLRVESDIQLLGAVVAHLVARGRPITLNEALADTTLASFDSALVASAKTRENKRGILRRLQAVHHGLPWREQRRKDGERVRSLVHHTCLEQIEKIAAQAERTLADERSDPDAEAFVAVLTQARAVRSERTEQTEATKPTAATSSRARASAARHDFTLTEPILRAVITHEILAMEVPLAVLIRNYRLTRSNLDLALTRTTTDVVRPASAEMALLRGTVHDQPRR